MKCCYCGSSYEELRPYGLNGSMVCFTCAFSTPERESETNSQFINQFLAASIYGPVTIGEETGPRPLINDKNN